MNSALGSAKAERVGVALIRLGADPDQRYKRLVPLNMILKTLDLGIMLQNEQAEATCE